MIDFLKNSNDNLYSIELKCDKCRKHGEVTIQDQEVKEINPDLANRLLDEIKDSFCRHLEEEFSRILNIKR